jgi:hypothetical protein
VDRTVINHIIAKRQKTMMEKPDVRFKDLDIIAMLDKRKRYHQLFSNHKSASFLAKRRRKGWEREASNQQEVIHLSSDSENESEGDCSDSEAEFDSDQDDMLVPFDDEDGLDGYYYAVDDGVSLPSGNEDKDQEAQISQSEETEKPQPKEDLYEDQEETKESQSKEGLNEDEIDLNEDEYDSDSSDDDELVEMRMKELDSTYEQELMKSLGFYTKQDILDYEQTKKQSKDIVKPLH